MADIKPTEVVLSPKERKIADRIKLMLGGSVVKVEIGDKEIKSLIDIALDTAAPHITDYKYITVPYQPSIDLSESGVEEVLRVIPARQVQTQYGTGEEFSFEFAIWTYADRLEFDKLHAIDIMKRSITPDLDIPFDFDAETKLLMVTPGIISGSITIEAIPTVFSIEDIRDKVMLKWLYLYTLALAKEVVGRIRSKAKSSNVPIELDGDTLLGEAASEKQALESSLLSDQAGPIAIIR